MSVNDQITRIRNNVTNSLSAVQEKGVSVPAGANSDNLPGLIAQISGGDATVEEITNEAGGKSVYINSEVPKLPEGFTRLKYIRSTGTQCIDTGLQPNQDTRIKMEVDILSSSTSFLFGARASSSGVRFGMAVMTGTTVRFDYATSATTLTVASPIGRYTIDMDGNSFRFGSTNGTQTAATFEVGYNLFLLAMNTAGTAGTNGTPAKLYTCQIYDNGTLVRDYVPCLNASGVAGLYDMVNGVFYADAAGGAFVAGPVVLEYELPEGYMQVECIKSSGEQYINTGILINSSTYNKYRFVFDIEYPSIGGSYWSVNGLSGNGVVYYFGISNTGMIAYGNGTTDNQTGFIAPAGRYTIDFNPAGGAFKFGDLVNFTGRTFSAPSGSGNFYLFAYNTGSSQDKHTEINYGGKVYENGTLIRDFVPVVGTGGAGLYDLVEGKFYSNAGSGSFETGAAILKPGVSKVVLEDQVLIDLTSDTVTPEALLSGFTAHNAIGQLIQGAASAGRGFATGAFTPTSNVTSMAISGLSFTPTKVILTTTTEQTWIDYSKSCFYWAVYDPENSVSLLWRSYLDSDYGMMMISTYPASTLNVAMSSGGFTVSAFSYGTYLYFPGNATYRWYAIG